MTARRASSTLNVVRQISLFLLAAGAVACLAAAPPPPAWPPAPSIYGPPTPVLSQRLHQHGRCDHPSRWHNGRKVWWYLSGWEFVEDGKLYRYEPRSAP